MTTTISPLHKIQGNLPIEFTIEIKRFICYWYQVMDRRGMGDNRLIYYRKAKQFWWTTRLGESRVPGFTDWVNEAQDYYRDDVNSNFKKEMVEFR